MAHTYKVLVSSPVTSSSTSFGAYSTLLTVGAGKSVIINRMIMSNVAQTTVEVEFRFRVVPSGATASDNHIVASYEGTAGRVNGGTLKAVSETPFVLGAGDTLSVAVKGSTSTSTTVAITAFGVEIS
jgi:hypothetical protein